MDEEQEQIIIDMVKPKRGRPFKKQVQDESSTNENQVTQSIQEKLLDKLKLKLNILNKAKADYNKALAKLQRV